MFLINFFSFFLERWLSGFKVLVILRADLCLLPSTHISQLTTACNSIFKRFGVLFALPEHLHTHGIHWCAQACVCRGHKVVSALFSSCWFWGLNSSCQFGAWCLYSLSHLEGPTLNALFATQNLKLMLSLLPQSTEYQD